MVTDWNGKAGQRRIRLATIQPEHPVILRLHILLKFKNPLWKSVPSIGEQLPPWPPSSRPTRGRGRNMGSSWRTYTHSNAQSSKRVVFSLTTSDKDRSERAVVELTLGTNCYCQLFSPETLLHFLKGEDESGLKRRLKCWRARGGSSGDYEWDGRGCAARRGLAMIHVLTMFDSYMYLSVPSWNGSGSHVSVRCVAQLWLFLFTFNKC